MSKVLRSVKVSLVRRKSTRSNSNNYKLTSDIEPYSNDQSIKNQISSPPSTSLSSHLQKYITMVQQQITTAKNNLHQIPTISKYLVACGNNGYIHVLETHTNKTKKIQCSSQCYCIAIYNDLLLVGTDQNDLEVRSISTGDILQLNQPICSLLVANSLLFAGSVDAKVVMIDLNNYLNQIKYFHGHIGPILGISVHIQNDWLATSSCDGFVKIFNIVQQKLIKEIHGIDQQNDLKTVKLLAKLD
ncbi:unnamed protein product [Rotaria sp. Silwood2]|nr:unnamed protein product [Rotaria sp. Silwood2]